ncbi:MAG: hypothetical protein M0Z36_07975 [Thermaerobacter sp.]|nr:hypothetical protein [Thermaerobacter sp.]
MRSLKNGFYFRRHGRNRAWGLAAGAAGGLLIIKTLPLLIWPFGIGLWLLWAGLGPIIVGGALIWIGWRLLSA